MTITIKEENKAFTLTKKEYQDYIAWTKKQVRKQNIYKSKLDKINDNLPNDIFATDKYPTTVKEWMLKGIK